MNLYTFRLPPEHHRNLAVVEQRIPAHTEEEARASASRNHGTEGPEVWQTLEPKVAPIAQTPAEKEPSMLARGMFVGEEMTVFFTASAYQSDYGVPGSPTFTEFEDVEIEYIEILGVEVKEKDLPADLINALTELSSEVEFEVDEV